MANLAEQSRNLLLVGPGYTCRRIADLTALPTTTIGRHAPGFGDRHVAWDALAGGSVAWDAAGADVVYSIPTLYKSVPEDDRFLDPVRRALTASKGFRSFIYLSSTAVYGDHGGDWVDEESERRPTSPFGVMRKAIEDVVLAHGGYVVRVVGIYGPGRTLKEAFERGRYRLVNRDKVSNRIHVDDLARVVLAVVEQLPDRRVFIAADGNPIRVGDLVDWLEDRVGVSPPAETTLELYERERGVNNAARWRNTIRCRNDAIRDGLGIELRFPNVIDGYRAIFDVAP